MTAARSARGGGSTVVRRSTKSTGTTRKRASTRSKKQQSIFDGLPVSPETAKRLLGWGGVLALSVLVIATLLAFRVPQRIAAGVGEGIGAAGFAVKNIEVLGPTRDHQPAVYRIVGGHVGRAMPMIDLAAVRDELMALPWVKEARVSRRLPDALVVEIVERQPVAVWQYNRRLQLVDIEGIALAPVDPDALPRLPLVVGPDAQHQVAAIGTLLDAAPALRERVVASSWVGGRRWDLTFASGETLALPEGEAAARAALQRFTQLASESHLFDGRFLRFDMRIEGQMIVQRRTAPPPGAPQVGAPGTGAPAVAPQVARPARPLRPARPGATPPADATRTI